MLHNNTNSYNFVTTGQVVDTNDPQQRGRVRVYCMSFGDMPGSSIEDIPWCQTSTPFGGSINSQVFSRGTDEGNVTNGPVSYGMWMIPKVGALVMVTCLNGNPMMRVTIGCLHLTGLAHTMPNGRFIVDPNIDKDPGNDGPRSSTEQPIEPLYTNSRIAFNVDPKAYSYEWSTRVVDRSVSKIQAGAIQAGDVISTKPDIPTNGYQKSRLAPNLTYSSSTNINYDSNVYAWVSPGFHSIMMDDSVDNGRMRLRTASGHQILLDDTNERVYIMTAKGENWIELDQDGSIDIFASQKISIHSVNDINLTSDQQVRILGKLGVHISSPASEIRLTSKQDTHIISNANIRMQSAASSFLSSGADLHCSVSSNAYISTGSTLHLLASGDAKISSSGSLGLLSSGATAITSADSLNLLAAGDLVGSGSTIQLNSASAAAASSATAAKPAAALNANITSRIPAHEPWARVDSESNISTAPKYKYDDKKIGRDYVTRNKYWRR